MRTGLERARLDARGQSERAAGLGLSWGLLVSMFLTRVGWFGMQLTREELFLVTKLPPSGMRPAGVQFWLDRSLKALRTDYLDLFLLHVPIGFVDAGEQLLPLNEEGTAVQLDPDTDHVAVWKVLCGPGDGVRRIKQV